MILSVKILLWESHFWLHKQLKSSIIRKLHFYRSVRVVIKLGTLFLMALIIYWLIQYSLLCWGGTLKTLIDSFIVAQNYFLQVIMEICKRESSFHCKLIWKFCLKTTLRFEVLIFFLLKEVIVEIITSFITQETSPTNITD